MTQRVKINGTLYRNVDNKIDILVFGKKNAGGGWNEPSLNFFPSRGLWAAWSSLRYFLVRGLRIAWSFFRYFLHIYIKKNLLSSSLLKRAGQNLTVIVRHKIWNSIHFNWNINKTLDYKVFEFWTLLKHCLHDAFFYCYLKKMCRNQSANGIISPIKNLLY